MSAEVRSQPSPLEAALLPGLEALMAKKGWLFVMWGILLLPSADRVRRDPARRSGQADF